MAAPIAVHQQQLDSGAAGQSSNYHHLTSANSYHHTTTNHDNHQATAYHLSNSQHQHQQQQQHPAINNQSNNSFHLSPYEQRQIAHSSHNSLRHQPEASTYYYQQQQQQQEYRTPYDDTAVSSYSTPCSGYSTASQQQSAYQPFAAVAGNQLQQVQQSQQLQQQQQQHAGCYQSYADYIYSNSALGSHHQGRSALDNNPHQQHHQSWRKQQLECNSTRTTNEEEKDQLDGKINILEELATSKSKSKTARQTATNSQERSVLTELDSSGKSSAGSSNSSRSRHNSAADGEENERTGRLANQVEDVNDQDDDDSSVADGGSYDATITKRRKLHPRTAKSCRVNENYLELAATTNQSLLFDCEQQQQQQRRQTSDSYLDKAADYYAASFSSTAQVSAVTTAKQIQQNNSSNNVSSACDQLATTTNDTNNPETSGTNNSTSAEYSQLRILEMRKEKSRDAARSRRSKENHEFYELAKLLPLPAAITSQLDFLDKASIIRLTISFLKLRQFSVNGYPAWAPDFTTLGSVNPYSSQSLSSYAAEQQQQGIVSATAATAAKSRTPAEKLDAEPQQSPLPTNVAFAVGSSAAAASYQQDHAATRTSALPAAQAAAGHSHTNLFDLHQGTHILQSLDGFAFAIGRDGKFLYISETVSMYLGLSQVEMTGSSVFDYTHQQDHEELAKQLGIPYAPINPSSVVGATLACNQDLLNPVESPLQPPASVRSQYSAASNETLIDDYVNTTTTTKATTNTITQKRQKLARGAYGSQVKKVAGGGQLPTIKLEQQTSCNVISNSPALRHEPKQQHESDDDNDHDDNNSGDNNNNNNNSNKRTWPHTAAIGTREDPLVRQFCIRMKSTLTKRGCQHFKSSGYRVVHVVAHLRSYQSNDHGHLMDPLDDPSSVATNTKTVPTPAAPAPASAPATIPPAPGSSIKLQNAGDKRKRDATRAKFACDKSTTSSSSSSATSSNKSSRDADNTCDITEQQQQQEQKIAPPPAAKIIGLVAVAIALPPPSINELRLESDTFVLRLGLDLRITHIEPKITDLLHYPIEMVAGKSLYSLIHPADADQVQRCHRDLLKKGQMMSGYYRLLSRSGGYIWIQTCATLICNNTLGTSATHSSLTLPNSPSLSTTTGSSAMLQNEHYLSPLNNSKQQQQQQQQVVTSYASAASPASHLSSSTNFGSDQTMFAEQDQCVIFVNYMITNVVECGEILDICQSANCAPLHPPQSSHQQSLAPQTMNGSASTSSTSSSSLSGNHLSFNSPSSCNSSSTISTTICHNNSSSSNNNNISSSSNNNKTHASYSSTSSASTGSAAARHASRRQQQSTSEQAPISKRDIKLANGPASASRKTHINQQHATGKALHAHISNHHHLHAANNISESKATYQQVVSSEHSNGSASYLQHQQQQYAAMSAATNYNIDYYEHQQQMIAQQQQQHQQESLAPLYYHHSSAGGAGGVNLATFAAIGKQSDSHWLSPRTHHLNQHHEQQQQQHHQHQQQQHHHHQQQQQQQTRGQACDLNSIGTYFGAQQVSHQQAPPAATVTATAAAAAASAAVYPPVAPTSYYYGYYM